MDYHAYLHKLWVSGIMESVESNNFYRLGTTLTTGHLAKLHLAVSQSLLAQELFWLSVESNNWHNWETTGTTYWWVTWNHGISGIKQLLQTGNNSYNGSSRKVAPGGVAKPACAGGYSMAVGRLRREIGQN